MALIYSFEPLTKVIVQRDIRSDKTVGFESFWSVSYDDGEHKG